MDAGPSKRALTCNRTATGCRAQVAKDADEAEDEENFEEVITRRQMTHRRCTVQESIQTDRKAGTKTDTGPRI
jgi:hypothetical protein